MVTQRKRQGPGMVYLVMGGQYGSEGKGEFVAYLAYQLHRSGRLGAVVRTGGPNAGHTMTIGDSHWKMRQVPCAWHLTNPQVPLFVGPGSLIDPEVLERELEEHPHVDLQIDPSAIIITEEDRKTEQETLGLRAKIGSTTEGIGAARANHVLRRATRANDEGAPEFIRELTGNVAVSLDYILESGYDVLVESTQGFGLSLNYSGCYPYTTSRDLTPAQILNDAGISSRRDHRVLVVLRTFPIRVAGNSGPLANEVTWEEMARFTDGHAQPERTTVTNLIRRIGTYDSALVRNMALHCRPDAVCLTFADYLDPTLHKETNPHKVRQALGSDLLAMVGRDAKAPVRWIATAPGVFADEGYPVLGIEMGARDRLAWRRESEVELGLSPGMTEDSIRTQQG